MKQSQQSANRRRHERTLLSVKIKLISASNKEYILESGNISDSGAYVFNMDHCDLQVGEVVRIQIIGLEGGDDSSPLVAAKVVRTDTQGLGLEFVE